LHDFALDPQIAANSLPVTELKLSSVRLMRDANYPWLLLVPRRFGLVELTDLDATEQMDLMREIASASTALRAVALADKLNIATLGNMVRQLHVHVIARRRDDPAWPKPVWGAVPAKTYAPGAAEALAAKLAARLK
jgi:diadenosine tetraphosphate (Ap4A) HIT family hydrolase